MKINCQQKSFISIEQISLSDDYDKNGPTDFTHGLMHVGIHNNKHSDYNYFLLQVEISVRNGN